MIVLSATDLSYRTARGVILASNISFTLEHGQILHITGPRGAGKSTLLSVLLGLYGKSRGVLQRKTAAEQIAYVPQFANTVFFLPLTLRDVITLEVGPSCSDEQALALGLLDRELLDAPWEGASGGERKRALLTRAFLLKPQLLIIDEPFLHLDALSQDRLKSLFFDFLAQDPQAERAVVVACEQGAFSESTPVPVIHLPLHRGAWRQ